MRHGYAMYDLDRFISAQAEDYDTALAELRRGRKTSLWIWYVFPQLAVLGCSFRARHFGIADIGEARAYMDHGVLGPRYLRCVGALIVHECRPAEKIIGSRIDAPKLRSSPTLMTVVGGRPQLDIALAAFFSGGWREPTLAVLDGLSRALRERVACR